MDPVVEAVREMMFDQMIGTFEDYFRGKFRGIITVERSVVGVLAT